MDLMMMLWTPAAILGLFTVILLLMWAFTALMPVRRKTPVNRPAPEPAAPPAMAAAHPPQPAPRPAPAPVRQAPPVGSAPALSIIGGPEAGRQIPIPADSFGVGRYENPEGNVAVGLEERSVSRSHAFIRHDPASRQYFLQDLGSTYGTYVMVDGQPRKLVPGREERIYNQDILQFGSLVQARITLPIETRPSAGSHTLLE
jgi:hypothetical protein